MVEFIEDLIWKPTKRQETFLSIPDEVREGMFGGAAGGGKSETLLMLPIARGFYKAPRFKGILFRRTFPELEKSLILRSESDGYYSGTGGQYNRQIRRWRWPSGAILDFAYAEHENDVRKYDTTEYNYVGWDELTSFTEFQYMYITFSRARTSDSRLPVLVRSGTNPGNIGHGWVRKRFVEPTPFGTIIRDKLTGMLRIFIQSLVTDNKYIMEADPGYIRGLEMLPEAEKRAKLYGDWWTFSGQVFEDWRMEPFIDEPSNARHVIPAFDIPSYWPVVLATDWGYSAMTWNGFFAASPHKRAYLFKEYACMRTKISTWGTELGKMVEGMNLVDAVLDPSAWQNTGVEKTVAIQLMESSGISYRCADNDRLGGKILMQEYLRWRPKPLKKIPATGFDPELASWIMRNKGPVDHAKYCDSFVPEAPEGNLPKLQVFEECEEFQRAVPLCVYNSDSVGSKARLDKEDVAQFDGDDPYDGGRYGLKAVDRYYNQSIRAFEGVERREVVLKQFEATHDYTTLHRQMEKLERGERDARQPMRRFHRGSPTRRVF